MLPVQDGACAKKRPLRPSILFNSVSVKVPIHNTAARYTFQKEIEKKVKGKNTTLSKPLEIVAIKNLPLTDRNLEQNHLSVAVQHGMSAPSNWFSVQEHPGSVQTLSLKEEQDKQETCRRNP